MWLRLLWVTGVTLICVLLDARVAYSQGISPRFNKTLFECEGQYALMPASDEDSAHLCVYVYLDRTAGFTMQIVTSVTISPAGVLRRKPSPLDTMNASMKIRIRNGDPRRVAALTPSMVTQLGLEPEPSWAKNYRHSDRTKDVAFRAYNLNHLGFSARALEILTPVYTPSMSDTLFLTEYTYALNATQQFDTACLVCTRALEVGVSDVRLMKEYGYCLMMLNRYDDAIKAMEQALAMCGSSHVEREAAAELCVNIGMAKRLQGDEAAAREWFDKAKATVPESSPLAKRIKQL